MSDLVGLSISLHSVSHLSKRCEAWIVLDVSLNQDKAVVCKYSFLGGEVVKKVFFPLITTDKMQFTLQHTLFITAKKEQRYHDQ